MTKKLLCIMLALLMVVPTLSGVAFAKNESTDKIQTSLSKYFMLEKEFEKITQYVGSNSYNNLK